MAMEVGRVFRLDWCEESVALISGSVWSMFSLARNKTHQAWPGAGMGSQLFGIIPEYGF